MFFKKSKKIKPEAVKKSEGLATAAETVPNQFYCLINSSKKITTPDQLAAILANKIYSLGELRQDVTYFKTQDDLTRCIEAFQKLNGLDKPQADEGMLRKIEYFYIARFEIDPAPIEITTLKVPNLDLSRLSPEKMKFGFYEGNMALLTLKKISEDEILPLRQEKSTYFSLLPEEIMAMVAEKVKASKHPFPLRLISIDTITGWSLLELDKTHIQPLNLEAANKPNRPR